MRHTLRIARVAAGLLTGVLPALSGTLYVNDSSFVYSYTSGGTRSTFSTQPGTTTLAMAFNSSGTLFAAARDSNAIYAYAPNGTRSVFTNVNSPYGLTIDESDNVYVGYSGITKYTPAGAGSLFNSSANVRELAYAGGIPYELDNDNNRYKLDSGGNRSLFVTIPSQWSGFGLAIDGSGNAYVGNWALHTVDKYTPGGYAACSRLSPEERHNCQSS